MKIKLITILVILLGLTTMSFAQKRYTDGYIVTFNNDTIRGKIKDKGALSNGVTYSRIRFLDSNGKKKKFSARKIKAYSKQNVINYRSINHKWFGEVVVDGDAVLLERTKMHRVNGASGMGGAGGMGMGNTGGVGYNVKQTMYYLQIKGSAADEYVRLKRLLFATNYAILFKKCPEVQKLVESQSLVYNDMIVIVRKYNECVGKQQKK